MPAFKDLTGQQFGELTVVARSPVKCGVKVMWLCRCACGKETLVSGSNLTSRQVLSCGCCQPFNGTAEGTYIVTPGVRVRDLSGQVFGKLRVIAFDRVAEHGAHWHCRCECGREVSVRADGLRSGHATSCGCAAVLGRGYSGATILTPSGVAIADLTGKTFGKLTVLAYSHTNHRGTHWHVRCACGTEKVMPAGKFRTGKQYSCGCAAKLATARKETFRKYEWTAAVNGERLALRSGYEVAVIEYFVRHKVRFEYEPTVFALPDGSRYIPDFYLPDSDTYLEVKGYMRGRADEKIALFRSLGNRLILVTKASIRSYLPGRTSYECFLRHYRKRTQ